MSMSFSLSVFLSHFFFFFFTVTATTEIYTLSLHDALPICGKIRQSTSTRSSSTRGASSRRTNPSQPGVSAARAPRSEEHTFELQSRQYRVCHLLLAKEKNKKTNKKTDNKQT